MTFSDKTETKTIPGNISVKMHKQIESIRNLARTKIKVSHDANKRQKRTIPIKSKERITINPHDSAYIPVHINKALTKANYVFKPSTDKFEAMKSIHAPEALINSETYFPSIGIVID